jgi:hypothetical protein
LPFGAEPVNLAGIAAEGRPARLDERQRLLGPFAGLAAGDFPRRPKFSAIARRQRRANPHISRKSMKRLAASRLRW